MPGRNGNHVRIHGVISWFCESPAWLAATVSSMARVCDTVTAVDGRYALYPHDMPASPTSEATTIMETAEGCGLPLTLHRPTEAFFGNEVEKRNLLLKLMMVNATPFEDWMLILDGDEYVVEVASNFRERVAALKEDALEFGLQEYVDVNDPEAKIRVATHMSMPDVWTVPLRAMYRVLPEMAYEHSHASIRGIVDGEKRWLWGHPKMVPAANMMHELVVRHRNPLRAQFRKQQSAAYYAERDRLGIELAPPQ